MLCSLLLFVSLAQDPEGKAKEAAASRKDPVGTADAGLPPAKPIGDAEAKQALGKLWKPQDKVSLATKLERVEALALLQHKNLIKPLAVVIQSDPQLTVRKAAARALVRQPPAAAHQVILDLFSDERVKDSPEVLAVLVEGLAEAGYQGSDWAVIKRHFDRDFLPARYGLQQQILRLVAKHKEKQALKLLLTHLDEPIPEDVHGKDNPPAEYWEKRYKAWQVWREDVKTTLFTVTGQNFSTAKEARAWLKVNGAKLGITDF